MADKRLDKWYVWLSTYISPEIQTMHVYRLVWSEVQEIIQRNGALPASYWWQFMGDTYGVTQAVGLRRQAEARRGVVSLGRLVREISEDSTRLSRSFFLSRFGHDVDKIAWAEGYWAEQYAGDAGNHLDAAIPSADLDRIVVAVAQVKGFVDQHLAHRDRRALSPTASMPRLSEAHDAIDVLGAVYRKYFCLMTGVREAVLIPRFDHDWQSVFRQRWLNGMHAARTR